MSQQRRDYDSTVARMAGNIAPALFATGVFYKQNGNIDGDGIARAAVALAREIVAEVKRTEPAQDNIMHIMPTTVTTVFGGGR